MAYARWTILVGALSLCAFGCSSSSSGTPNGPVCNNLVADGPTVPYTVVAAAAPTPAGGTITDGTYELTSLTVYTGVNGSTTPIASTACMVMTVAGSTVQTVDVVNGQEHRYTSTLSVSGTMFTMNDTCPARDTSSIQLTATATEIRLYGTQSGFTMELRFTKR
jgi:hypothetical protein